jgi:hypothetical protein
MRRFGGAGFGADFDRERELDFLAATRPPLCWVEVHINVANIETERLAGRYNPPDMRDAEFDEIAFFRAIQESGVRSLLIGRRVLVLLGLPVLTADYDFWIDIDQIAAFNDAIAPYGLQPTRSPDEARRAGRYAAENDEHVDVLVARSVPTTDGVSVGFEDVWSRRTTIALANDVLVSVPAISDLILTKRFASRPKDLEDIRLLTVLQRENPA